MKLYLYTLLLILNLQSSKKKISGNIIYGFQENHISSEEKDKNKELYGLLDKMNSATKHLNFILQFNKNESLFFLENQMENDLNPLTISYAKRIISKGKYYYNHEKEILLRETDIYGDNTIIQSNPKNLKWTLTNESKYIDTYITYKATTTIAKQNTNGKSHFKIEAWYTPEIQLPYGPNGYNGLPGLILELKDVNYTFYVKKIKIQHNETLDIIPLSSKKTITEEEHLDLFAKRFEN